MQDARIPYRSGLMAGKRPSVIFTVPAEHLEDAREAIVAQFGEGLGPRTRAARFPRQALFIVGAVILFHFLVVFWMLASVDSGRGVIEWGGLRKGSMLAEPWRLITSLFLHIDPLHAFWNGASMMVFAVPLLERFGYRRCALIYFASGVGGGLTALHFARVGALIVGSSGAVAGLFGAWLVFALGRARLAPSTSGAYVRTLGIALLFIPSLISPMTSTGHSVSIGSHLGGLATGALVGVLISTGLMRRFRQAGG